MGGVRFRRSGPGVRLAKPVRSLMVLGTASHVGKSVLTAALCRILKQDGFDVAPFKAQNMALNSAATPEGLEIGRAQAMQAEAAGIAPSVDMNPILLKPCGDSRSQLVVRGRVAGEITAAAYHRRRVRELFDVVVESYRRLADRHDVVVLEGAGSPVEVNLAESDIVNMRMARAADAACLLVADIDRGGVFASLVGTFSLLSPEDRRRVRGFVVNRFRGDPSLFRPGVTFLERRLARPCLGVIPHLQDLGLDEEDSVCLETRHGPATWGDDKGKHRRLRMGVIAFPRLSNFTDFDPLFAEPAVDVRFVSRAADLVRADAVVLPGSKQTLDDLAWLKHRGLGNAVRAHADRGGVVIGICGGMQMLGEEISDPEGMEGGGTRMGLGLLGLRTVLGRDKVTVRARATLLRPELFGQPMRTSALDGYEIHLGTTVYGPTTRPLFRVRRDGGAQDGEDGASSAAGRVIGTYLHGFFDSDRFRHAALRALRAAAGLAPPTTLARFTEEREKRFDRLAAHVRRAIDVGRIERWLR
jgi:adenosylcobyric acid synthase